MRQNTPVTEPIPNNQIKILDFTVSSVKLVGTMTTATVTVMTFWIRRSLTCSTTLSTKRTKVTSFSQNIKDSILSGLFYNRSTITVPDARMLTCQDFRTKSNMASNILQI